MIKMNKIYLKIIMGLILLTLTGNNVIQISAVHPLDVPITFSDQSGVSITIQADYEYTDLLNADSTLAIYVVFTIDGRIDAAMLLFHCNNEINIYWTLENPQINPWFWQKGYMDQHFTFDDSTLVLNFMEYLGVQNQLRELYIFANHFTDITFDPTYVDFPYYLRTFPTFGANNTPSSETTTETISTSLEETSTSTTNTSSIISTTDESSESKTEGITSLPPDSLVTPSFSILGALTIFSIAIIIKKR